MYIYFVFALIILLLIINYCGIASCYNKKENIFWVFTQTTILNIFLGLLLLVVLAHFSPTKDIKPNPNDFILGQ